MKNWRESEDLLKKVAKNLETYNAVDYKYGQTYFVICEFLKSSAIVESADWKAESSV